MSGLDFLRRIASGELPGAPISGVLAFEPTTVEHGRVVFAGTPELRFYNPIGVVHGGWAATLLDSCMGCAVHSTLEPGQGYTTVEIKVSFVRPLMASTGPVEAKAASSIPAAASPRPKAAWSIRPADSTPTAPRPASSCRSDAPRPGAASNGPRAPFVLDHEDRRIRESVGMRASGTATDHTRMRALQTPVNGMRALTRREAVPIVKAGFSRRSAPALL